MQSAFVDDLGIIAPTMTLPSSQEALINTVSAMPKAVVEIISKHGKVINDKPGKSGVMFALAGRGLQHRA